MNRFGLKSDPSRCEHVVRRRPRLKLKHKKKETRAKKIRFYAAMYAREREERKRRAKGFFSQSTVFRRSEVIGLRTKVHRIDEGYT